MQIQPGLRTWGWVVEKDLQELLELLRLQYRKEFVAGNVKEEGGLRLVQVVAPCSGCEKETIDAVHAILSFWNWQQARKHGLAFRPSTVTGKVKPCGECEKARTAG